MKMHIKQMEEIPTYRRYSIKDLKNLPKTYIAVAEHDTLRDDGRLFKSALDAG
jgi:acetyl esterase/lipase